MKQKKLGVLFTAFEASPFLKTGGLGDVAGSLPAALKKAGVDIRVMIPNFSDIPEKYKSKMKHVADFTVSLGWRNLYCGIEEYKLGTVTYYFIDNKYYFDRGGAYGFFDDGERIAFFSKACVESLQYLTDFKCDILHCNDWHTALSTVFLREFYQNLPLYENVKTIFTIHNLKFQGQMSDFVLGDICGLSGIEAASNQLRIDKHSINFMLGALHYADLLSTVSKSYAEEIQTPFFGENLDYMFRQRPGELYGIMNGIDVKSYDPVTDKNLVANYSVDDLKGKVLNKEELQRKLGLEVNKDIPLLVMIGRLTEQKGLDLVQRMMDEILNEKLQFVVLGTGERHYEDMFRFYESKYPNMRAILKFDEGFSHLLYAASDIFLMPSLFEPCGLAQMVAMHYGSLPIVRQTGGLKDSVKAYNPITKEGTGFGFENYNAHDMYYAIQRALDLYNNHPKTFKKMMKEAMSEDFSWHVRAKEYIELYKKAMEK